MASNKKKPKGLYYLLPSTKAEAKSRFYRNVIWSIIVGGLAALLLIGLLMAMSRP